MTTYSLHIPVKPEPKGRPRVSVRKRKDGSSFAMAYTPDKTRSAENAITAYVRAWLQARPSVQPFQGPIHVSCAFVLARPRSLSKRILPVSKPDLDNYLKLLCDSLNSILWVDDSQIVSVRSRKVYEGTNFEWDRGFLTAEVGIYIQVEELMSPQKNDQKRFTLSRKGDKA